MEKAKNSENKSGSPKWKSILLMVIGTFFTSSAQITYKMGASRLALSFQGTLGNIPLISGLVLYAISALIFIIVLKRLELSVAYPLISLSFVWVALSSSFLLGESVSPANIIGIVLVIAGVSFIGWGGGK